MKKGQITVFIILGLAMLLAVLLFLYQRNSLQVFRPDIVVPEELVPLQQYVDSCLYDTAKDGILRLGLQSGFINVPSDISHVPASYVAVDPYGIVIRPYWYFRGQSRVPTLDYIQWEITDYVEKNMGSCINDFSAFEKQFKVSTQQPKIKTTIDENSVLLELEYPLEIRDLKLDKVTKMKDFQSSIPVRLKSVYDLASKIMAAENQKQFFENITIDLMAADSKIPFTGMELHCGPMKWQLASLKDELQQTVKYNFPRIRVENTDYAPFLEPRSSYEKFRKFTMEDVNNGKLPPISPPADAYEYFHFMLDAGSTDKTLKATFSYKPQQGMDFMAYPSKDGVLSSAVSQGMGEYLQFLCVNVYHFVYDVSYPVEVSVRDDSSFDGSGYLFSFAFPVIVQHNKPDRADKGTMIFEPSTRVEGFCENLGSDTVTVTAFGTYEGFSDMEVPGVSINYQCMQNQCYLGDTRANNGHYQFSSNLPAGCSGPFIVANKTGYLTETQQLTGPTMDIKLKKLNKLKLNVMKHVYQETEDSLGDQEYLEKGERAVVSIQLVNSTYHQFINFNTTANISLVESDSLYNIDIILLKNDDFAGGYKADNVPISGLDVMNSAQLTLQVVDYRPTPVDEQQKLKMTSYLYEGKYKDKLTPVLT